MSENLPGHAQVVIVGGGIVGCSVAYHLAQLGWSDVVLLERKELTCGTTWHAAGLVPQLRATHSMTRLAKYTGELYRKLEEETGQATGFRQSGSLIVASSDARLEELKRNASMGRCFGIDVDMLSPEEAAEKWPLLRHDDLTGAIFVPADGYTNPVDTTQALAKGARANGVRIIKNVEVTGVMQKDGAAIGVETDYGAVRSEYVVNCAGMWSREIGRLCGVQVPLHAAEHFYIVTEPMEEMNSSLPVVRDLDNHIYFREDAGKMLLGMFEPNAKPWGTHGIPRDFCFDSLPEDVDHIMPILEQAFRRIPKLEETGIQLFFNGPESFTPDDRYLLGPAPNLDRFFVAAGFNSVGIQSAGGAGMVLARWMTDGVVPMDLWEVDIRRMMPFQGTRRYLYDRTKETLGLMYAMHWPHQQPETARGVRTSPLHDRLAVNGACFGETAGWERANWFAPDGVKPVYEYSFGRQNWFRFSAREHQAAREKVALFDQSSFAKIKVEGHDAAAVLNYICGNDVDCDPDRIVYTQWLNERGGIEADLTVTRLADDEFLVVTGAPDQTSDLHWLRSHIPAGAQVRITDVTSMYATLGIMGPDSRNLLQQLTDTDLSNEAFPFATSREIDLGYAQVRASRITYVGELGWELYIPSEYARSVYDAIVEEGSKFGLAHAGYHAINSLRLEKGFRLWGHDITTEDTPYEAGLRFAVAMDKPGGFLGHDALVARKDEKLTRRMVSVLLTDENVMMYHDEPIWRDGKLVGRVTSAMFGHTLGACVGLGYISNDAGVSKTFVETGKFEIEVAGERVDAQVSLKPFYDPGNKRIRM